MFRWVLLSLDGRFLRAHLGRSFNEPFHVLMEVFSTPPDTFNARVDAFSTLMDTFNASMDAFYCANRCFLVR